MKLSPRTEGKWRVLIRFSHSGEKDMRKIAAAQIAALVAGMVMGDHTSAEETFTFPTVSVTGTYNTVTRFGWTTNNYSIGRGTIPQSLGNYTSTRSAEHKKALNCAKAYTNTGPGANLGQKPGAAMWMTNNYGWYMTNSSGQVIGVKSTTTNTSPGAGWKSAAAITFNKDTTYIFTPNNPDMASMIESIAHEWGHQWGASDSGTGDSMDAEAIGEAAKAAYLADSGKKCGGL